MNQSILCELLTKCDVEMAGYYRAKLFFCVFMDGVDVPHKLAKKNEANIQPTGHDG